MHWPELRLPYYWDEAGYYIPAAYDFFRWGTLIPRSTLTNAHPPLPSMYLAAWWKIFGFSPLTTRSAVCAVAALGLLAVYRVARAAVPRDAAVCVAVLTATYPVWFAQSTLAHADIFAAAATLWGLALLVQPRPKYAAASVAFCMAALCKETAVITPVALAAWEAAQGWRNRETSPVRDQLCPVLLLLLPAGVLACWYGYHHHETGFAFGNPEFLRYNATGTLHAARLWFAVPHRFWHLAGHMNLWVPGILSLALWLLPARVNAGRVPRRIFVPLTVAFVVNALAFCFIGGALLTRYLLPLFPLALLFHVAFWHGRTSAWLLPVGATLMAFLIGWTVDPPYQFAAEDNLSYAAAVRVEQQAIEQILQQNPDATVLTAWPVSDYLSHPYLGYVQRPMRVVGIQNFSAPSLFQARQLQFTHALLFGPVNPRPNALTKFFAPANRDYFGLHDDVPPALAARILGGTLDWQQILHRQLAAVVSRDAPVDAQLRRR